VGHHARVRRVRRAGAVERRIAKRHPRRRRVSLFQFKDTLRRYRREKDWYAYREEALRQIAIEWCEENGIEYTES
jgi:hypothetical protein